MRGISFTTANRPHRQPPLPSPRPPSSHGSSASKMIKKLSTTFRRKTNVSPTSVISAPQVLTAPSTPPPEENKPHHSPQSPVLSSVITDCPPKARAMTFSIGSRMDEDDTSPMSTPDIPFFNDTDIPPTKHRPPIPHNPVAVVRGKPSWLRSENDPVPNQKPHPRQMSHQPSSKNVIVNTENKPPPTDYVRQRHYSFDIDAPTQARRRPNNRDIFPSRRRWLIPLSSSPEKPALFQPPADSKFERIARHRDRAEGKVLVSACTYIEAEIDRMSQQASAADACCCNSTTCECAHRQYLVGSAERMRAILAILEERYDTIEQVYVKSEEYARAMGKFFQLSPSEFNRIVTQRDAAANKQQKSQKSLR